MSKPNVLLLNREIHYVTPAQVSEIQPECFPLNQPRNCVTHHHACDCREHMQAVLIKAAIDAAVALDELKSHSSDPDEDRCIVERVFSACEALQK